MAEFMFTISAVFDAETEDDAWDDWRDWLRQRRTVEDGTHVVKFPEEP